MPKTDRLLKEVTLSNGEVEKTYRGYVRGAHSIFYWGKWRGVYRQCDRVVHFIWTTKNRDLIYEIETRLVKQSTTREKNGELV